MNRKKPLGRALQPADFLARAKACRQAIERLNELEKQPIQPGEGVHVRARWAVAQMLHRHAKMWEAKANAKP